MRKLQLFFAVQIIFTALNAQMDVPPSGGNPRAMVSEEVGITSITIKYGRPDVNKREGKVYRGRKAGYLWFQHYQFYNQWQYLSLAGRCQ